MCCKQKILHLKNVYLQSLHDVKCGKRNWVFNVKRILDIYGFSDVFNNPASYNPILILSLLKDNGRLFQTRMVFTY